MNEKSIHLKKRLQDLSSHPFSWIILLALMVRFYACLSGFIINPDGIHYIHQARSFFYGEWEELTTCYVNYISILPVLIASAFTILGDWIAAGRCVTVIFGTATLIPLYFILRRFLNSTLSRITILLYALMPVLVNRSVSIVRGPVFWFFLCLGILFFLRQWDDDKPQRKYRSDLYLSCIFLLLATWTRTEGVYAILVSGFYILITNHEHKITRLIHFLTPLVLILLVGAAVLGSIASIEAHHLRLDRVVNELNHFIPTYKALRVQLKELISQHSGWMAEFFHHVRTLVWFMPLSIIFNSIWEAFFYPYALIYFIGFIGIRNRIKSNRHVAYFLWLSFFSIVVLYIHLLRTWLIHHRFLVILILPSCIIIGFGIDNILQYFQKRFRLRSSIAVGIMVALIILSGLIKGILPREEDKRIFQQAGQLIAEQKANDQTSPILAACSTVYQWVFFYAHLDYPGTRCATKRCDNIPVDYDHLVATLKSKDVQYVLYEEKKWPKEKIDLMQSPYQTDFEVLGRWKHKDTGNLVLLKLK